MLAYDIGGTTATAGLVRRDHTLVAEPAELPLRSAGRLGDIADDLEALRRRCFAAAGLDAASPVAAIGVGFPAPADYVSGTSWAEHKLGAMYGRSWTALLGRQGVPIAFINDADALGLGEALAGAGRGCRKVLALTLGTGLGSAFIVEGAAVHRGVGVPPDGELWNQPFAGSAHTIEEEVGRFALERRYRVLGGNPRLSLKEIAARAQVGERAAVAVFEHLGQALAVAVTSTVRAFGPQRIVLGGAISRSHALFMPLFQQRLAELAGWPVPVVVARLGARAALVGAAAAARQRVARFPQRKLIYLHGFASSPRSGKAIRFVESLRTRSVAVSVPDLNENDFRNLTLSRQLALLDRLTSGRPPGSVLLVGSSFGGYTAALQAARTDQVAALVLMAPAFDFARRWLERIGPDAARSWQDGGELLVPHYGYGREEPIGWSLIADALQHPPFPDVRVPTLVFHGRHDESVDPELSVRFAQGRPNVQLELLDADHGLLDVTEHIIERSLAFLAPWWR